MSSYTVSTPYGDVPVTLTERGSGSPVLLLHGGGAEPDDVAAAGADDRFLSHGALPSKVIMRVNSRDDSLLSQLMQVHSHEERVPP